nr:hypothetical protein [Tanacetum cinerariifolium]
LRVGVAGEGLGGLSEKEPPPVSSSLIGEVIVSSAGSDGQDEDGISKIGLVDDMPELGVGPNRIGGGDDYLGGECIRSVEGCGSTTEDDEGEETSCG